MEHLESVEEARYMVEQSMMELDLESVGIQMDAAHEQDQADCQLEGVSEHPEYVHLDTDGLVSDDEKRAGAGLFKKINIPGLTELREETRRLDRFQRKALN